MKTRSEVLCRVPSEYEQQVLREIHSWRTQTPGPLGEVVAQVNKGLRKVTDLALKVPGAQWAVDNVAPGLLSVTNEMVQDTVWQSSIYDAYCKRGYHVEKPADIRALKLREVEKTLEGAGVKYRALSAVQGAAAAVAGLAGIVPDVVGLVAMNLRAVGEYATYYGYDIRKDKERTFALHILDAEARTAAEGDSKGRAQVEEVSRELANYYTKGTIKQVAVSASLRGLAATLGRRLTLIKIGQTIPLAGVLIGGGVNILYTQRVCNAARQLYRERHLMGHYPHTILENYYSF